MARRVGTPGDDTLDGNFGDDLTGLGPDRSNEEDTFFTIEGGAGDDAVGGTPSPDRLLGGRGSDRMELVAIGDDRVTSGTVVFNGARAEALTIDFDVPDGSQASRFIGLGEIRPAGLALEA